MSRTQRYFFNALFVLSIVLVFTLGKATALNVQAASGTSQSDAITLSMDGNWSGNYTLSESSSEHWYKFEMPKDGRVYFKLMSYFNYLSYIVYNSDLSETIYSSGINNRVGGTENSPQTKTFDERVLSAGTYYIKLSTSNTNNNCNYKIVGYINELYDNTDQTAISYDSPKEISLDTSYVGDFTVTDSSEDWYKITVNTSKYYILNMTSYFNHLSYIVYNADLSSKIVVNTYNTRVPGTASSPGNLKLDMKLDSGTYYIKLTGGTGKYIVSVDTLTPDNCTHKYEDTKTAATYYEQGYTTHTCPKCGHSYVDSYVDKLTLSSTDFNKYQTKNKNKSVKLTWTKVSDASGYEIEYSQNKKFKKSKTVTINKGSKVTTKIRKKLTRNKKYYFRVRAYVKSGKNIAYSDWSKKYKLKIK
ncbi:MAG: fibronectin type III domain-containing protein [Butyrivibrio sp.]|nr:fibronectin type III domain-containing protein [Butyrivibrio sp.]